MARDRPRRAVTQNPRRAVAMERRSRMPWAWLGAASLACTLGVGGGSAWALWSATDTSAEVILNQAAFGFAVTKASADPDANPVPDVASAGSDSVQFSFGPAEAVTLIASPPDNQGRFWLAVPFDVTMLTSAGYGMDYALSSNDASDDTILGWQGAEPVFFQVENPGGCTPAAASQATAYDEGDTVKGIAAGTSTQQTQVDHWCAVIAIEPDTYTNTATAQGTQVGGTSEDSTADDAATWMSYLLPDPADEPDTSLTVTLTPTLVEGECES